LKKFISFAAVIQLLLVLSFQAAAQFQPAEVVKSQQKTIINGKIYYIHTVQKGQTLFSISKVYGVTQEDILNENPGLNPANIREGQAIRIKEAPKAQAAVYPDNREDYYAHSVKKKETVYSIAKRFKVTEDIIYQQNPWAREGIKPDQTIWVPKKAEKTELAENMAQADQYYYYTARDKDTLYSISKLYGVTVADIIQNNPVLSGGLKPGQVLKIPKSAMQATDQLVQADSLSDILLPCQVSDEPVKYKVALLLPLFAGYTMVDAAMPVDSINEEGTYISVQKQHGLRGRNFAEFYEGFLLAVDSLKKSGLSVDLYVKDTEHDTLNTVKIIRELKTIQPDLIIGPVYSEDVAIAGRYANLGQIGLVSPLSTRHSLVSANPEIIQVMPSRQSEGIALARYLKENFTGKFILIRGADSTSRSNSWRFKKYFLDSSNADSMVPPVQLIDYMLSDSLISVMDKVLSREQENIIIVFSENEAEVSRLVTVLYMKSSACPIRLFGMPAWQTWENVDLDYLHHLQLYLITPFYTNFASAATKQFLRKCRSQYDYEPYEISPSGYTFSMLGYDIGFYFLSALKQYGKAFRSCINDVNADQLLTRYKFYKTGDGGYVNDSFNLIRYKSDYTIERIAILNSR
jgi:LysM repeat protein/ABC-type branched-subunit amino acid transport system substrate-binding protein